MRRKPAARAVAAIGSTPRAWRTAPSSDSSPMIMADSTESRGISPSSSSTPTAMGRS